MVRCTGRGGLRLSLLRGRVLRLSEMVGFSLVSLTPRGVRCSVTGLWIGLVGDWNGVCLFVWWAGYSALYGLYVLSSTFYLLRWLGLGLTAQE
ncbi:uncharacterized protein BO66DRAFT_388765 [Aspergillus aculeatinus CBS 121060]|uniref:Uncharacterized protein n=1 Tax=Aspergillus aculeatinus CBS 121060 TaxID=1448322 RepID=A0ACD1HJX6_9EURO|nr:hypothetical protein BO66DRAFT_388765 [Aspergillus aculeatinus CBS 121060]RAH73663.1 hypothetical protein BO66DRAFT_388765 [Aspergillus aculeatinus CBS 121060]